MEEEKMKKDLENMKQKTKDLYKRISARDYIIKKYKTKFKDPTIENEFEKIKRNEQIGKYQDDNEAINKLKEEHMKQTETLNNKIETYEKDIESLKNKNKEYENEIESLKNKNKEFEKEIDSLKNKNEQYENEIETLKNKNEQYENEIEPLKNKNKEYDKEIKSSKDKIKQYENDIEALKNKNKEFEKEISDKQELLEKEIKEKENKDKLILEKENEIKNISEELKKVQKDNSNKSAENEEKIKSELEQQKNKIESYEKDISKKDEEISNLKQLLEDSKNKINEKDDTIKSYEAEIKKQKPNIEKLQREKDNLENKIKEMNNNNKIEEVHEVQLSQNQIKEEINKNAKDYCEKYIENKMKEINTLLNNKIKQSLNEYEQKYLKKYNKAEEQMNLVYNQNTQKINELKGYLSNLNYNLCQNFEEKNSFSGEHQHDFINAKKELKSNNVPIVNNEINKKESFDKIEKKNKIIGNNEYSYECINILQLSLYLYEGTEEGKIEITLKNNGSKAWPEGRTRLCFERESQINGNEIILRPQKPGEEGKYDIILNGLETYSPNQYKSYLVFCIDDDEYGEDIVLTINIKEKNANKKEMMENMDKVNEFRSMFDLSAKEYSDEKLFEILKQCNFDYEDSFSQLFDNNI